MFFLLFPAELFLLYFLSQLLTKHFSLFFHITTKSKNVSIYLLALIFLPGTFIHELAHFLMAKIVFVAAGKIRLLPELQGDQVKLGSVSVGKTDVIRRFLIGIAPFLFGTSILLGLMYYILQHELINNSWVVAFLLYCVFEIGNTMFSSKKDLEGSLWLILILFVFIIISYVIGIRVSIAHVLTNPILNALLQKGVYYLLIPIILDSIIIFLLQLLNKR